MRIYLLNRMTGIHDSILFSLRHICGQLQTASSAFANSSD